MARYKEYAGESVHELCFIHNLDEKLTYERARMLLSPEKDIEGLTDRSLSGVFTSTEKGFPSCTAQAVMELLAFYGFDLRVACVARKNNEHSKARKLRRPPLA